MLRQLVSFRQILHVYVNIFSGLLWKIKAIESGHVGASREHSNHLREHLPIVTWLVFLQKERNYNQSRAFTHSNVQNKKYTWTEVESGIWLSILSEFYRHCCCYDLLPSIAYTNVLKGQLNNFFHNYVHNRLFEKVCRPFLFFHKCPQPTILLSNKSNLNQCFKWSRQFKSMWHLRRMPGFYWRRAWLNTLNWWTDEWMPPPPPIIIILRSPTDPSIIGWPLRTGALRGAFPGL